MAKKKLTLEDVLVPKEEIPYEVPENWASVKLTGIFKFEKGKKPKILLDEADDNTIPYVTINYFQTKEAKQYTYETETNRICTEDDILIVWDGARAGLVGMGVSGALGSTLCKVKFTGLNPKFVYYYFVGKYDEINKNTKGTGIPHVDPSYLDTLVFNIPPLAEQVRIVNRIESLFDKVDKASELVDEARDGFEKRRAAILERAFCGELTRKWREEKGVEFNVEMKAFNDIATVKSNLVKPQEHMNYPHIAPDNIEKKTGRLLEYRTIEEDNVKSAKHKFCPNQILYSKIRPYLSKVVMVDFEGLCSADMYPIETELETKYLYWYMLSQKFVDYASNCGSRSVLPKINQKELGKIPVPVVGREEQKEIVKIIDKLIEAEKSVEEISDISECTGIIKKSILTKAFRGELGSNYLDEECAIELLKNLIK